MWLLVVIKSVSILAPLLYLVGNKKVDIYIDYKWSLLKEKLKRKSGVKTTARRISKDMFYVDYVMPPLGREEYTIIVKKKHSPHRILSVWSEAGDVTMLLKKFLGPNEDFHGASVTPALIGFKELLFFYENGNEKTFRDNDIINL